MAQNRRDPPFRIRQSSLLASVSVRFSVHAIQESVTKTYPICDDLLSRPKQRSIALAKKSILNRHFVCKRKPYPIMFLLPTQELSGIVSIPAQSIRLFDVIKHINFTFDAPWESTVRRGGHVGLRHCSVGHSSCGSLVISMLAPLQC